MYISTHIYTYMNAYCRNIAKYCDLRPRSLHEDYDPYRYYCVTSLRSYFRSTT